MEETRTRNSQKNIVFAYIQQIVTIFLKLASRTVTINVLGADYLGISSLFSDILNLLSLADLGFSTAMAYTFYKPIAEGDNKKISQLVNFYGKIYNIIAAVVMGLGIACMPFLPYIVNLENAVPHIYLYYFLYVVNSAVSYLFVYKTILLTASQKNYILVRMQLIVNVVLTCIQMFLLWLTKNFIVCLVVMILITICQNIYPSIQVKKIYPEIKSKHKLPKDEQNKIFRTLRDVFIYKVSGKLVTSTDNILISTLVGTTVVGYYSNYSMLVTYLTGFVTAIFTSITASVGNLLVSKKETSEKKFEVFEIEQTVAMMISNIVVICYCILINDFINVWVGREYILNSFVVFAVCLNFYLTCIFQPLWSFREASGLYLKTKWINVATAIVNLILSIILGNIIGLGGILIATPISKLVTYFWYEPPILFKAYFGKSAKGYFGEIAKNTVLILAIAGVTLFISSKIAVTNWISWLIEAVVVGIITTIMTVVFYLKTAGCQMVFKRIKNIIKQ